MTKYDGPSWAAAKKEIKKRFSEARIYRCELRYEGCTDTLFLTYAHSLRRRRIETKEQMEQVILACQPDHARLDAQKEQETYAEVLKVINRRPIKVKSIYEGNQNVGGLATVFEVEQHKTANAKVRYRNKARGTRTVSTPRGKQDAGIRED